MHIAPALKGDRKKTAAGAEGRTYTFIYCKASLKTVEGCHLTWNEGLPHSQEIILLLQGFHSRCVYAGYLKHRYSSPSVGITASPELNPESHSWCYSHTCRVWNHFLSDLLCFCFLGLGGVGSACLESRVAFPRVSFWGGCHSWEDTAAGWAGTKTRHARWDTASCSGTAHLTRCLAVSVDIFEEFILLVQKTHHSLEKCCSTPKLGHWGKWEQTEKITFSEVWFLLRQYVVCYEMA